VSRPHIACSAHSRRDAPSTLSASIIDAQREKQNLRHALITRPLCIALSKNSLRSHLSNCQEYGHQPDSSFSFMPRPTLVCGEHYVFGSTVRLSVRSSARSLSVNTYFEWRDISWLMPISHRRRGQDYMSCLVLSASAVWNELTTVKTVDDRKFRNWTCLVVFAVSSSLKMRYAYWVLSCLDPVSNLQLGL